MTPTVFSLWGASVLADIVVQVIVELYGPFDSLSSTHLVERLALFSLIIFGGGYENIGLALNAISPQEHNKTSLSGGWRFATVLNALSAVAIIMLLFFGEFRSGQVNLVLAPSDHFLFSRLLQESSQAAPSSSHCRLVLVLSSHSLAHCQVSRHSIHRESVDDLPTATDILLFP
jgi:hypothetical protein